MKKIFFIMLFIIFSFFLFGNDYITIVFAEDVPPFSYEDENGVITGLLPLINGLILDNLGVSYIYQILPWQRAQKMVIDGLADAFITTPTEERKNFTYSSAVPVINANLKIFFNKNNPKAHIIKNIKSIEELKSFNIATHHGSGWARQNLQDFDILEIRTIEQLILMLLMERIDLFTEIDYTVYNIVNKNPLIFEDIFNDFIDVSNYSLDTINFHFMINKNSKFSYIINKYDDFLTNIEENDDYINIINNYLVNY